MENGFSYFLYFVAYASSLLAFSFNSIQTLRILTILSSSCYAIYYFIFPKEPLWLDILTEGLLVGINVMMFSFLWYRQRKINFKIEEEEVYSAFFKDLSAFEFYKLVKIATWENYERGVQLIEKNKTVDAIYFIYNGELIVKLDGERTVSLRDGYFVGERSFSLNQLANADVFVADKSRLIKWQQNELKNLFNRNPIMQKHFEKAVSIDMAKKLNM
jgi:hypothetical protein